MNIIDSLTEVSSSSSSQFVVNDVGNGRRSHFFIYKDPEVCEKER